MKSIELDKHGAMGDVSVLGLGRWQFSPAKGCGRLDAGSTNATDRGNLWCLGSHCTTEHASFAKSYSCLLTSSITNLRLPETTLNLPNQLLPFDIAHTRPVAFLKYVSHNLTSLPPLGSLNLARPFLPSPLRPTRPLCISPTGPHSPTTIPHSISSSTWHKIPPKFPIAAHSLHHGSDTLRARRREGTHSPCLTSTDPRPHGRIPEFTTVNFRWTRTIADNCT